MKPNPEWGPMGNAFLDYYHGNRMACIRIISSVETDREVLVETFFGNERTFSDLEFRAMKECKGRVLDAGAGSGCHSVYLRDKMKLDVLPIDINPGAVQVMHERGLSNAGNIDFFELENEKFDTILMLMNGIGICGDLAGLERFLFHAKTLLNPGGQIIFDSTDIKYVEPHIRRMATLQDYDPDYYGTVWYQLSYKGVKGKPYPWLFLDLETLAEKTKAAGYIYSILQEEEEQYLASLVLEE